MGNSNSRCLDAAYEAKDNAREIRRQRGGGMSVRGAIVAYIEGRLNEEEMITGGTELEVMNLELRTKNPVNLIPKLTHFVA